MGDDTAALTDEELRALDSAFVRNGLDITAVERIVAAREAAAEQRGRAEAWEEGFDAGVKSSAVPSHRNPYRERADREAQP